MHSELPLVSVCMPAYNAEQYISAALNSVLDQTYPNIEIIVVDDGSTDRTNEILDTYLDKGIRVIHQKNAGQCSAANAAFQVSSGKYIKFFDADDLLSREMISHQVELAEETFDCVISAKWGRFYNNDLETFSFNPEKCWRTLESTEWIKCSWEKAEPMLQCGIFLIPRKILEKKGGWDERLTLINDFEFFTRVILGSEKVVFSPDSTLFYRSGVPNSLSGTKSRKAAESAILSVQLATSYLLAKENTPVTKKLCANCFQTLVYEFYHTYPDLIKPIEERINTLGGSSLEIGGGNLFVTATKILGWRSAKSLRRLFN